MKSSAKQSAFFQAAAGWVGAALKSESSSFFGELAQDVVFCKSASIASTKIKNKKIKIINIIKNKKIKKAKLV